MTHQALDQSTKTSYLRVTFTWDPTNTFQQQKYTDLPDALPGGFTSVPAMKVKIPKITGTLEKTDCVIELPADTFSLRLANGRPHAPIQVLVEEVTAPMVAGPATNILTLFRGRCMTAKENPAGKSGIVRIKARRPKARLQIATGLPVMHHCPFNTYGPGSQLVRASFVDIRRIDLIVGRVVTIDADPLEAAGWFKNGYMEFEGLTIKIREWDGTTGFTLMDRPPDDWLSEFVNIYAGSNKTIEDVRDKLSNVINFGGIGYKIPAYHPNVEDAPGG